MHLGELVGFKSDSESSCDNSFFVFFAFLQSHDVLFGRLPLELVSAIEVCTFIDNIFADFEKVVKLL